MFKLRYLLTALTLGFVTTICSQDTVWISAQGKQVTKDSATRFNVIHKDRSDSQIVKVLRYEMDGVIRSEANYFPFTPKPVLHGPSRIYNNGQLVDERMYNHDSLQGSHKTFWSNGRLRRNDKYENDNFISGQCYGRDGADTAWFAYEVRPSFPGGSDSLRRFISRRVRYPAEEKRNGVEGTVRVGFTIDKEGMITDLTILRTVHPSLDKEAIRVINLMPPWIPGRQDGEPVKFKFILPVTFRME